MFNQGIPLAAFESDIQKEYQPLKSLAVLFKGEPTKADPVIAAQPLTILTGLRSRLPCSTYRER
jgi:hypothetical protein